MRLFDKDIKKRSDEDLVQLLQGRRSNEALTELHARYAAKLLGFFIRMFEGDKDKAQDFVQDVFMRILEKNHQFNPEKRFYTWMFTIASNMAKTSFRSAKNVMISSDDYELNDFAVLNDNLNDKKQFNEKLRIGIDQLDPIHREAFVLRHIQGLTINEIAEVAGVSTGTVKSRVFYGTKKIADFVKEYKPDESENIFKIN